MKPKTRFFKSAIGSTTTSVMVMTLAAVSAAGAATWTGATSQDWNVVTNWDADPAGQNVFINTATGNTPVVSNPTPTAVGEVRVGDAGNNGLLEINTTGTLTTGYFGLATNGSSNATVNVNSGTVNAAFTEIGHGGNNTTTQVGALNVNTGATWSSEGDIVVGFAGGAGSSGTLNVSGGTVNVASGTYRWLIMGRWDSVASTLNVNNGGTLNLNANTDIRCLDSNGARTINVDNGTINGTGGNYMWLKNGTLTVQNGGQIKNWGRIDVAQGTVNIENTGKITTTTGYDAYEGTTNVRGVLESAWVASGAASCNVNIDGGTIRATGSAAPFLNFWGGAKVNIQSNGATIDSNGFDISANTPLLEDAVSTGGGLTKLGAGKLTLGGTANSTYTGATTVSAGRLIMGGTPATSGVSIAAGASLGVENPAEATPATGTLTVPTASFGAGASLSIETGSDGTSSEKLVVSNSIGLDISAGVSVILNPDGLTTGSLTGTYEIINYTDAIIGSTANLSVANPRAGFIYNFVDDFNGKISVEVISFDADGDGLPDQWEIDNGLNPNDATGDNGADGNPDGDFATNLEEFENETDPQLASSDPNNTDNDGLLDSWEVTNFGNITAQTGTGDPDGDLATNLQEFTASPQTDPNNGDSWPDADGDLMNDAWEAAYSITSDGTTDTDGDGFTDKEEHDASTDPSLATGSGISPIWTELKHRWSFNGNLTDSVGGSDATIVDIGVNDVTVDSTSVTMTGGAKADSDYVKLGENLIPNTTTPVTIELWAKQNTIQNWSRVFDFHTDTNEYLMMIWTQGTNDATDRVEFKDAAGTLTVNNAIQPYGTTDEHHIVMTLEPLVGTNGQTRVTVYAAPSSASDLGPAKVVGETAANLVNFQDALNALGYSPYPDNTASATYNEVRIWNGALAGWMAERMHDLGPDNVTVDDLDGDHLPDAWEAEYSFNATSLTADDDGDTFSNYAEYVAGTDPTNILSTPLDTDADGLLDSWEITHFGNIEAQDGSGDPDADGLTNEQEESGGTNPNDDEDGLDNGWEVFFFGSAATQIGTDDSDGDGFTNEQEEGVSQPNNIFSTPNDVNGDGILDVNQHTLASGDQVGTTSFNDGLNWNDGFAPAAGETYIVPRPDLRTPAADGDYVFAGDRIDVIETFNGQPILLIKGTGSLFIPNVVLNGGEIRNASDSNGTARVAGGIVEISDAGGISSHLAANNGPLAIDSMLTGTGIVNLWQDSVILTAVNTYTGTLYNNTANGLILESTGSYKFVPGASGVTNAILGGGPVSLDGQFNIDLSGASSNPGDAWDLVGGAITVNSNFSVAGFTPDASPVGSRIWTDGTYEYDEATGILSIPSANPDADGDEMDDEWETTYFGGTVETAEGDFDGDGTNNLTEFRLGLTPNDGSSTFKATRNAAGLISWPSVEGVTFAVQRSTTLGSWTTIATVPGTAGTASYTDPAPPAGKAFYRVLLNP